MKDALKEFSFAVPCSDEIVEHLVTLGYRRGCGDGSYYRNYYVIMPFKKVYYPASGWSGIKVSTEDIPIVKTKLVVEYPKN
jgi:hypothetical protein